MLSVSNLGKTFTMHLRGGLQLPVISGVDFRVLPGECVVLGGPSGIGKSSILKMIFGNYRIDAGSVIVNGIDIAAATPRQILMLRETTIGYVSQFLRVIPRVSTLDIVSEGSTPAHAKELLSRLNIPEKLWSLPPATFSGGEQQRVNIARGFAPDRALLLLDEPTASLDAMNRAAVVELINEKKRNGTAIVGIFHDEDVRDAVANHVIDVSAFRAKEAA